MYILNKDFFGVLRTGGGILRRSYKIVDQYFELLKRFLRKPASLPHCSCALTILEKIRKISRKNIETCSDLLHDLTDVFVEYMM